MTCVVRFMIPAAPIPLIDRSTYPAYDSGAFHPGTGRAHGHPALA
jgi:hypothetical protein